MFCPFVSSCKIKIYYHLLVQSFIKLHFAIERDFDNFLFCLWMCNDDCRLPINSLLKHDLIVALLRLVLNWILFIFRTRRSSSHWITGSRRSNTPHASQQTGPTLLSDWLVNLCLQIKKWIVAGTVFIILPNLLAMNASVPMSVHPSYIHCLDYYFLNAKPRFSLSNLTQIFI